MQNPNGGRPPRTPNPSPPGKDNDPSRRPAAPQPRRPRIPPWIVGVLLVAIVGWYVYQWFGPQSSGDRQTITYNALITQITDKNVKVATVSSSTVEADLVNAIKWDDNADAVVSASASTSSNAKTVTKVKATIPPVVRNDNQTLMTLLQDNGAIIKGKSDSSSLLTGLIFSFLPVLLFLGLIVFMGRQMTRGQQNVFGFGRSRARTHDPERPQVTFADVAGEDEAKKELTEVVDFLRNPAKYHQLGARLPRGVLLVGPPGTGKTLTARAVAGEAGVPFYSISASEFVEMFVGVGASRVRDLFEKAKSTAPAIIFIDELDAVGRQRFAGLGGSNDEREQTLNQLLVEMDGFDTNQEVIVMAATNRPDVLDPALLRPGRFDRQVTVGLPDRKGREAILGIHTRGIPIAKEVDLAGIARATTGFSGADLSNLVNEAALTAARRNRREILNADFDEALDKVLLGTVRSGLANPREREVVAFHEAGHALVAHFTPGADPLRKVTIVPRGRALGVAIQSPDEDRYNVSKTYLFGRLDVALGGRASEMIVYNEVTTGAENDLKQATSLARRMVGMWGMSDEVGPVYLGTGEEHVFLGREIVQDKAYSDNTAERLDGAIRGIVEDALQRALTLVNSRRTELHKLVDALLEKETLDAVEVTRILGPRPEDPTLIRPTQPQPSVVEVAETASGAPI